MKKILMKRIECMQTRVSCNEMIDTPMLLVVEILSIQDKPKKLF